MLSRCTVDYYSASVHATLASAGVGRNPTVRVRRDWFFLDGGPRANNRLRPHQLAARAALWA